MMRKRFLKYINIGMAVAVLGGLLFSSCVNDLDQLPIDPNQLTGEQVYQTEEGYQQVLAKIYAGLALTGQEGPAGNGDVGGIDEGSSSFVRNLWNAQVLTTDEAICSWGDFGIPQLNFLQFSAANPFIEGLYYRIYHEIAMANEFLRQSTDDKLNSRGQGNLIEGMQELRAEARFIRAFSYFIAIDAFGNVPFVTEEHGLGIYSPEQIKRADLFDWLIAEINDFEGDLSAANTASYGRVDQGAAWMLKAKLYLNAEVYKGAAMYDDVIKETEKINQAYAFYTGDYRNLFFADNNVTGEGSFIFTIPMDGDKMQTYGSTTFLCFSATGGDIPSGEIGLSGGWGGNRTRPSTLDRFENGDKRGWIEPRVVHAWYKKDPSDPDNRDADILVKEELVSGAAGVFWNTSEEREISWFVDENGNEIGERGDEINDNLGNRDIVNPQQFTDGFSVMKFRNINSDGSTPANKDFVTTDFPMFRLADSYLMYAEATMKGATGGDITKAVNYVNDLRERAFGDASGNITSSDLNDQFILDERSRELLWECTRRTDLIRFGKYTTSAYLWAWKGGVANGAAVSVNKRLFAIPAKDIGANSNLVQNPGY